MTKFFQINQLKKICIHLCQNVLTKSLMVLIVQYLHMVKQDLERLTQCLEKDLMILFNQEGQEEYFRLK